MLKKQEKTREKRCFKSMKKNVFFLLNIEMLKKKGNTVSELIRDQNLNDFRYAVSETESRAPQLFRTLKTLMIV